MSRAERKIDHIRHALSHSKSERSYFDDIDIVHQSLTAQNWEDLQLKTNVGELNLSSPLFVNAMTGGGGKKTEEINQSLAEAAKRTGIGMAVGSQMSAIKNKEERSTYEVVRKANPDGVIFANVGSEATLDQAKEAVDMIEANALQIHLNTLQELIMPEGDRDFRMRLKHIEAIVQGLHVPVIIKEVGYGVSKETANQLYDLGVRHIDVGGSGGTNFSKVENLRRNDPMISFENWGIPTPVSIVEVSKQVPDVHVIASGGIRNGLDGVKSLLLGADAFGMAGSLLKVMIEEGQEALVSKIEHIHREIKMAMMLLDIDHVKDFNGKPHVIRGDMKNWIDQR
ncbi:type 2 isopentenyl-diphosphate Delta-isomerase [Thalassobacillus hwangdonensis]|uniref:Isopentenyl-diphosphate delta-isomerase n=1 Tax=Thalassobacillus hwangdonensis TaxID=546108 RepID=A0ABW3KX91_9BACI